MTNIEVKDFIKNNGLIIGWVAEKVGIHRVIFSDFLNGRRILNDEQMNIIERFIRKYDVLDL